MIPETEADTPRRGREGEREFDAVIFDLDGVLTDTASLHFKAWKEMFDGYLEETAGPRQKREFTREDYREFVDGKPRYDGVESFLNSRGITLPYGAPGDSPEDETYCGLGNLKNEYYHRLLKEGGVDLFDSTLPVLDRLESEGVARGLVSSSRNTRLVLESAGIHDRFDAIVDGNDLAKLNLPGKPDPALFLEAAKRIGVEPERAVVVEDATSGVRAGREGGFGLVVGVDRDNAAQGLKGAGADVVIRDLRDLPFLQGGNDGSGGSDASVTSDPDPAPEKDAEEADGTDPEAGAVIRELPSALEMEAEVRKILEEGIPAIFLDYDGTLTPIVDDPSEARLSPDTRRVLQRLADLCTVAVVSGRDRWDVQNLVELDGLIYAGSHGFDVSGPEGVSQRRGEEYLPALDEAARRLEEAVAELDGAFVERKRFAVAVHFRKAEAGAEPRIEEWARRTEAEIPELRLTGGKKIFELRPDLEWDKGKALLHLLEVLGFGREKSRAVPVYIGDDLTDEDAFRVIRSHGLGIVVRGEDDERVTAARYALEDPGQVREFLESLVGIVERKSA
ncbi:MAG: trehalose-phosphatase [Longimicrobiales bacterium]